MCGVSNGASASPQTQGGSLALQMSPTLRTDLVLSILPWSALVTGHHLSR